MVAPNIQILNTDHTQSKLTIGWTAGDETQGYDFKLYRKLGEFPNSNFTEIPLPNPNRLNYSDFSSGVENFLNTSIIGNGEKWRNSSGNGAAKEIVKLTNDKFPFAFHGIHTGGAQHLIAQDFKECNIGDVLTVKGWFKTKEAEQSIEVQQGQGQTAAEGKVTFISEFFSSLEADTWEEFEFQIIADKTGVTGVYIGNDKFEPSEVWISGVELYINGSYIDGNIADTKPPEINVNDVTYNSFNATSKKLKLNLNHNGVDLGSTYIYKAVAIGLDDGVSYESEEVIGEVISGVKGYALLVNTTPTANLVVSNYTTPIATKTTELTLTESNKVYSHFAMLDNKNNISETISTEVDLTSPPLVDNWKINNSPIISESQQVGMVTGGKLIIASSRVVYPTAVTYDVALMRYTSLTDRVGVVVKEELKLSDPTNVDLNVNIFNEPNLKHGTIMGVRTKVYSTTGTNNGYSYSVKFILDYTEPTARLTITNSYPNVLYANTTSMATDKLSFNISLGSGYLIGMSSVSVSQRTKMPGGVWSGWTNVASTSPVTGGNNSIVTVKYSDMDIRGNRTRQLRFKGNNSYGGGTAYLSSMEIDDAYILSLTKSNNALVGIKVPIARYLGKTVSMQFTSGNGKINYTTQPVIISADGLKVTTKIGKNTLGAVATSTLDELSDIKNIATFEEASKSLQDNLMITSGTDEYLATTLTDYVINIELPNQTDLIIISRYRRFSDDDYKELPYKAVPNTIFSEYTSFTASLIDGNNSTNNLLSTYTLINSQITPPLLKYSNGQVPETPAGGEGEIDVFDSPVAVDAIPGESKSSMLTISTSYTFTPINGDGEIDEGSSEVVSDYENGTILNRGGSYAFTSSASYFYEPYNTTLISEESTLEFLLDLPDTIFIAPSFTQKILANDNVELYLNKNINDPRYSYTVYDTDTGVVNNSGVVVGGNTSNPKLAFAFTVNGTYNVSVDVVRNDGLSDTINTTVIVYHFPGGNTGNLASITYHDSYANDPNRLYNDAFLKPTALKWKDAIRTIEINKKKLIMSPNAAYPYFVGANVRIEEFSANIANRNHLHDITGSATVNITNLNDSSHKKTDTQLVDLNGIESTNTPDMPTISINSSERLTPFDPNADMSYCKKDITIAVTNKNANYDIKTFIDGNVYKDGSKFTSAGSHVYFVIFYDKHNYTISSFIFKFNIEMENKYTPPKITWTPNSRYSDKFTISISYKLFDGDDEDVKSRLYKLEEDTRWTDYTGPFEITNSTTVYARKLFNNGFYLDTEAVFDPGRLNVTPPSRPNISDITDPINPGNASIYIPAVEQKLGFRYKLTLNGLPYTEGDPITNYNRAVRKFVLTAEVTDILNKKSATFNKDITIDTMPPLTPELNNGIKHGEIVNVPPTTLLTIRNPESGVTYTFLVDGKVVDPKIALGTHKKGKFNSLVTIVVQAVKTTNKMASTVSFLVDLSNGHLTDEFYKDTSNRNALIPYFRENDRFTEPNELVINDRTADLYVTKTTKGKNGSYELANITIDIMKSLRDNNVIIGQYFKSMNLYREQTRWLTIWTKNLQTRNADLNTYITSLEKKVADLKKIIEAMDKTATATHNTVLKAVEDIKKLEIEFKGDFTTQYNKLMELNKTKIDTCKNNYIGYIYSYLEAESVAAKIMYNLESIRIEANKKVLTTTYNTFKNLREKHLTDVKALITKY